MMSSATRAASPDHGQPGPSCGANVTRIASAAVSHAEIMTARPRRRRQPPRSGCIEITRAEQALERYYGAIEQGKLSAERCEDRLVRLRARLDDLRAQEAELTV
jgi:hypothetical protein